MSEVGELGVVLLYRLAEKGLLPVSWFRHVDPAEVRKEKRRGRLRDETRLGTGDTPGSRASDLARRPGLGQHPCPPGNLLFGVS